MVAIIRKVGETITVGEDVFFELLQISEDKVTFEILSSKPVYVPYRGQVKPAYLGEPEVNLVEVT